MTRVKGFTLVELMVVIALVAIIASIAVPNFTSLIRDNRAESQAETLNSLLQYARSEAVIRKVNSAVTINATTGETTVSVAGNPLRSSILMTEGISFDVSETNVGYRPNGTVTVPNFRAVFCSADNATSGRLLTISGSGATTLHPKGKKGDGSALGSCTL